MVSAEHRHNVTVMLVGNAAGCLLPPFFIFKKQLRHKQLLNGALPQSEMYLGDSGWMTAQACYQWLQFFIGTYLPSYTWQVPTFDKGTT